MLDIGWSELLVIGGLALIVVGPKDLPRMMRTAGNMMGKARRVAREFQYSMDEAAREADIGSEINKALEPVKNLHEPEGWEKLVEPAAPDTEGPSDEDKMAQRQAKREARLSQIEADIAEMSEMEDAAQPEQKPS